LTSCIGFSSCFLKEGKWKSYIFFAFLFFKKCNKSYISFFPYLTKKNINWKKLHSVFFHGVILHLGVLFFLNFGCIFYRLWLRGAFQSKLSVWPGLRTVSTQRVLTHWEQKRWHLSGSLLSQCLDHAGFAVFLTRMLSQTPFCFDDMVWCMPRSKSALSGQIFFSASWFDGEEVIVAERNCTCLTTLGLPEYF
jgi:hypothetical protein